ncbi:hypothetical protein BT93_F1031 [Corymbia citriodora subsp. variegata]|nr:hypothetical protein BT93_F1031 [Corymbia citriodora subsp. variegata]
MINNAEKVNRIRQPQLYIKHTMGAEEQMIRQVHCPLISIEIYRQAKCSKISARRPRQAPTGHPTDIAKNPDLIPTGNQKRAQLELINRTQTATNDTCGHAEPQRRTRNASSTNPPSAN